MFSKRFWASIAIRALLIFSCGFLAGCNLPLNELPPTTDPIQVSLADSTACLSNVVPVFEVYFDGTATPEQINAMWDCMNSAVTTFEKSTEGRFEDRFTARELAHFIEQYFLERGTRISDTLLLEVFRIKQLFVGGAIDSISRVEMKNTRTVIQELRRISLNLNPYMKVYTFGWKTRGMRMWDADIGYFQEANSAVQQAAKDLAVLIEKNGLPYHLPNALVLIRELSAFGHSKWDWIDQVEKAMPLVEKLKKTLAGGDPAEIAPNEWRRFALLGGRGFVQYLRYYYFIKEADLTVGGTQLTYFIDSVRDLFSYVGDMVDGKPGQTLTRAELLEILQAVSNFVPKVKISDELLIQAMKLKVAFFGGRIDYFKKEDFDKASSKLEDFRKLTEKVLKYSSVYTLQWKPTNPTSQAAREHFEAAESNLKDVGQSIGEKIMENPYDLQDLIKLAAEVDKLYYPVGPDGKTLKEAAEKYIPVVVVFKNILFSDQTSVVGNIPDQAHQQWSVFLSTSAELYSRYMYYDYFLKDRTLTENPGLLFFGRLTFDTTHFLDHLIEQKPTKVISFTELNRLWASVIASGFLTDKVSLQTLNGLTQVLVQKILIPYEQRLANRLPNGLTTVATQVLRDEFGMWLTNQSTLGIVYQGVPEEVGKPSQALIADLNGSVQTEALSELKQIYSGPIPLSFDQKRRLYLSKPPLNYLRSTSNMINLVRTAVRLVIRSYAMSADRIKDLKGITVAEANTLFEDVKPLVRDLKLLSANSKGFAESRFRDANLFTPVSDGNDLADYRELSNLALMILSGIKIDSLIFEDLQKVCPIAKPNESDKDTWTVKLDCLAALYHEDMPRHFASMPDFIHFQGSLDQDRYLAMFTGLLKASGAQIDGNNNVSVGDLILFPNIVQYVEALFQVYDKDRNGELNTKESLAAYPIYRQILKDVSGLTDEKQIKGLFTWLLKYGKPPETLAEKIKFATWWVPKGEEGWDVSASREMLSKILGFIADALNKPKPGNMLPMDLRDLATLVPPDLH